MQKQDFGQLQGALKFLLLLLAISKLILIIHLSGRIINLLLKKLLFLYVIFLLIPKPLHQPCTISHSSAYCSSSSTLPVSNQCFIMLASEENNNKQGHTVKVLQTFKRISREQTKSKCIKHPIIFYSLIASLIGSVVVLAISAIIFSEYQVKIKKRFNG